ncbi:MAG: hypothetical protein ACI4TX_00735 [Christensenellales bacterium]
MNNTTIKIFAYIFLFGAIYYLFAEFVAIINSTSSLDAYILNTISSLSVPFEISNFSSQYKLMQSAFFINGPLFFICYNILFLNDLKSSKTTCIILTTLLTIGIIMVGYFHTECEYSILHLIGTIFTFLFGNIVIIYTGVNYKYATKNYKILCYLLGTIGIISALLIVLPTPNTLIPIFERLTIYPIITFEIYSSIMIIKQTKKRQSMSLNLL